MGARAAASARHPVAGRLARGAPLPGNIYGPQVGPTAGMFESVAQSLAGF